MLFTGKLKGTAGPTLVDCTSGEAAGNAIVLKNTYDQWGNVLTSTDGRDTVTQLTYDANNLYVVAKAEAYGTGVQRNWSYTPDPYSGKVKVQTDNDNTVSTTYNY